MGTNVPDLFPTKNKNVPDPYYGEISDFKNVFELLDKVCDEISKELLNEKN